jgi:hypothetical protein
MTMDGEAPEKSPKPRSTGGSAPSPPNEGVGELGVVIMLVVIAVLIIFVVAGGLSSY